jgi:hypothetical protein
LAPGSVNYFGYNIGFRIRELFITKIVQFYKYSSAERCQKFNV